jgi:hypothetical protein
MLTMRNSLKSIKQFDTQIERKIGYSTKHIVIGILTVIIILYVLMKLPLFRLLVIKFILTPIPLRGCFKSF